MLLRTFCLQQQQYFSVFENIFSYLSIIVRVIKMSALETCIRVWKQEAATTAKIMRAYPQDKLDIQPNPKSKDAKGLLWIFVGELAIGEMAIAGNIEFGKGGEAPDSVDEIVSIFEAKASSVIEKASQLTEEDLQKTVKFPVAPGTMGDVPLLDMFWILIHDMIHHRGQLSVYIRLADAKLPSIYGPTADEPWF